MILVTVGTHNKGFDRLVSAMDVLASDLDELIIIQYGTSRYIPHFAEGFQWTTSLKMLELTRQARVIVSHAAAGVVISAIKERKPLVVCPRLRRFGEHMDDHQLQLARALDKSGQAVAVFEPEPSKFKEAIFRATQLGSSTDKSEQLVLALKLRLSSWAATTKQRKEYK